MNEKSKINRYRDPLKQLKYINNWTSENYKNYTFRLHKIKDKEMIDEINNRTKSLPELIKEWYKKSKI